MTTLPWPADRPAKKTYSRDEIVRIGLRLVRSEGIDAVSMRRIATELGTGPSSLYAHLARAALATIPTGPNALRISNAMFGMMLAGDIPPRIGAWAMDRIFLYITADAYEYSIWRHQVKHAGSDKDTFISEMGRQTLAYFEQLPADIYPHITTYATALVGGSVEARFELGLELLVDGLDKYSGVS
ncbi:TetR/AcrR family transcriptional regulator [Actinoplanes sp. NPDC000266]